MDLETMRRLQNISPDEVTVPTYAFLSHSVCATDKDGCGWQGWLLEGAFEATGQMHPTGTGDRSLATVTAQICPNCGKVLFRTFGWRYYLSEQPQHI